MILPPANDGRQRRRPGVYIACPKCTRQNVKVRKSDNRIAYHDDPRTGERCDASGRETTGKGTKRVVAS